MFPRFLIFFHEISFVLFFFAVKVSMQNKNADITLQGRNHGKMLAATSAMVGRICPPGWDRIKVSGNLGATLVAPVAPVVTSLQSISII